MILSTTLGLNAAQTLANQTEIQAAGPEGALQGSLITAPAPSSTIALIVPGSGPTDRNGNNRYGLQTNTYKLLAEGLSTHGISTVRIDKRGMYGSSKAIANPNDVTIDDYASDIQTWVAAARKQTQASCVWLIGHSEGGLVSLVAAQHSQDICGLVLIATPGRPLGQLIKEQLASSPANAPILDEATSILSELEKGHKMNAEKIHPALLALFHPQVQGFLINALKFDPAKLISNIAKPILILQGLRDIQVSTSDAQILKEASSNSELKYLENTNHILKTVNSSSRDANIKTYSNPALPLADNTIESIGAFIQKHP